MTTNWTTRDKNQDFFRDFTTFRLPCDNPYGHFEFAQIFHVLSVSKGDGWKV